MAEKPLRVVIKRGDGDTRYVYIANGKKMVHVNTYDPEKMTGDTRILALRRAKELAKVLNSEVEVL